MAVNSPIRAAIKKSIESHWLTGFVYGGVTNLLTIYFQITNQPYRAYDLQCRALRYRGISPAPDKHCQTLRHIIQSHCYRGPKLLPLSENELLQSFRSSRNAKMTHDLSAPREPEDLVRLRLHRFDSDLGRQGNLIILKKYCPETREKGVILLKYNPTFELFSVVFDSERVRRDYRLVLEPSWTPNVLRQFALYIGSDAIVTVQCNNEFEVRFIESMYPNLSALLCSSSDWVDEDLFQPASDKVYDIAMVASWARVKRHRVLFRALQRLKDLSLKVALVGYAMERRVDSIHREARQFGVASDYEVFEKISPDEVSSIVAQSKMSLLLSKQEGGNKAIFESLFCDTPIVVYRHHQGINMSCVNDQTGMLADDHELPEVIEHMVNHYQQFSPRQWALEHTGSRIATRKLNDHLKDLAAAEGEPWTRDIVHKVNRPHLRYKHSADQNEMESEYDRLMHFVNEELRSSRTKKQAELNSCQ